MGWPGRAQRPKLPLTGLGGITADPPIGYHAIHIIVNGGHVILTGVVDSKTDADVAAIQANSTPGVFSVENDLRFPGGGEEQQKK